MISRVIENILRDKPQTRSSDKLLTLEIWSHYGLELSEAQRVRFLDCPSTETIRRVRQKIQEEGKYPADAKIRQHRQFKGMQVKQTMPQTKSENVDKAINSQGKLIDIPPTLKRIFF